MKPTRALPSGVRWFFVISSPFFIFALFRSSIPLLFLFLGLYLPSRSMSLFLGFYSSSSVCISLPGLCLSSLVSIPLPRFVSPFPVYVSLPWFLFLFLGLYLPSRSMSLFLGFYSSSSVSVPLPRFLSLFLGANRFRFRLRGASLRLVSPGNRRFSIFVLTFEHRF